MLSASGLHDASDRSEAVFALVWTVPWALVAIASGPRLPSRISLGWIVLVALMIRLPFVTTPWVLSDDAWRYLWEGQVLASGENPFIRSPDELPGLNDALRARVNHPEVSSIYPPLALGWFWLLHQLGGQPWIAQVTALLADLLTVSLLTRSPNSGSRAAWIYALLPLAAIESAGNAHLESLALPALTLCFVTWRRHPGRAHAWAAVSAGIKVLPLVVLPMWLHRWGFKRTLIQTLVACAALMLVASPVWMDGPEVLQGWAAYSRHWSFNGLLFPWLEPIIGSWTRLVLILVAAGACLLGLARMRHPAAFAALVGTVFLCTSPTVHPWYVLWAVVPSLWCGRVGWAAASTPLLLAYGALLGLDPDTGSWDVPAELWWITWGGAAVAAALARRWAKFAPSPTIE